MTAGRGSFPRRRRAAVVRARPALRLTQATEGERIARSNPVALRSRGFGGSWRPLLGRYADYPREPHSRRGGLRSPLVPDAYRPEAKARSLLQVRDAAISPVVRSPVVRTPSSSPRACMPVRPKPTRPDRRRGIERGARLH